jgi:predicted Ser/Thr protein kinase
MTGIVAGLASHATDVCGHGIVRELHRQSVRLAHPHMLGTVIGKYRIVGSLGRGATGVVYRAVDETLGREVAIKILSSEVAESDLLKRFRTEATALAKLNHHGIATIYELFSSGSDLLMVMEFVPGQTLEQLSDRESPMAPARAAYLVARLLSALEHAHRAGIVHRDMKPANVMVSHAGALKIMDFGIARVRGVEHFTVDGCMMGTPAYMAPEHVRGEEVDERADLYAVGVIFYRLLTGRLPFDADTTVVMLQKHISEPPTALRVHRTDLPPWCESIVRRAMAKRPAERFQTASEFSTALSRAAGEAPRASRAEDAGGAYAEDAPRVARPRKTTMVLSPKAATAIRKSVRSSAAARRSAFVRPRWAKALSVTGLAASFLLLVQAGHRPAATRVNQPAAVVSAAVLAPPAALASPPALAPPAAAVTPPSKVKRPAKAQAVVARPARKTYPALAFATKGLVESGHERQVRDVRLVLAGNSIAVTDDATRERLQIVPYNDVSAIIYSHGRDPMSNSSDGPTRIVRTAGRFSRVLGISARYHWISLMTRTDRRFVILRVTDSQVGDVLSALEERTGRTPQLLESRQGTD